MYQPRHFQETDPARLADLMNKHPLATLVTLGPDDAPAADLLPLQWHPEEVAGPRLGWLRGHVARANPLWQQAAGQSVLAVFQGPQAYVSPGWYSSKQEHGKAVPTWNYAVVQARGCLRTIDDPMQLQTLLTALTAQHEAVQAHPWQLSDAPADYLASMLRAIVGIEIEVTHLVGKYKLSQNRAEPDRQGVIRGLLGSEPQPAHPMAELMQNWPAQP